MIGSNPNVSSASLSISSSITDINHDTNIRAQTIKLLKEIRAAQNLEPEDENFTLVCEQAEELLNSIENKNSNDWRDLVLVCENLCAIYFANAHAVADKDYNQARCLVSKSFAMFKATVQAYAKINEFSYLQDFFEIIADRFGLIGRQQLEFICKMWITVEKNLSGKYFDSPIEGSTTFRPILEAIMQKWVGHNSSSSITSASSYNQSSSSSSSSSSSASSMAANSLMASHYSATSSSSSSFSSVLASLEHDQSPNSPFTMLHDIAQIILPTPKSSAAAQIPTPQSLGVAQTLAASLSLKQVKKDSQRSAFTSVIFPTKTQQSTVLLTSSMASLQIQGISSSSTPNTIGSTAQLTSAIVAPTVSQLLASLSPGTVEQPNYPTFQSPQSPQSLTPQNIQNQNLLTNPQLLQALLKTTAAIEGSATSIEIASTASLTHTEQSSFAPMSSTATSAVVSNPTETAIVVSSSPLTTCGFFNNSQPIIEPSLLSLSPRTSSAIIGHQAEATPQNSSADFSTTNTGSANPSYNLNRTKDS